MRNQTTKNHPLTQATASTLDVITLSFRLLYERFPFWLKINFWFLLLSLPLITAPAAKASLYAVTASGLRDPAGTKIQGKQELLSNLPKHITKAWAITATKWISFIIITFSIVFWITRDAWPLRLISLLSFYSLFLWRQTACFLYPVLIEHPELSTREIITHAFLLAFRKPFETLLLMVVSNLLLFFGIILMGPVMLFIPALRAIIQIQGYWYLTGETIPGFMDIVQYTNQYEQSTEH